MSCTTNYDQQPCQPITTGDIDALVYVKGKNANGCDKYALFPAQQAQFITGIADTNSLDLSVVAGILSGLAKISAAAGNSITVNADGLFVPPANPCSLGQAIPGGVAASYVGKDATGCLVSFTPAAAFVSGIADTNTVNLSVAAGTLSADAIIDPNAANDLVANVGGLFVDVPVKGIKVDGVTIAPDANGIVNVTDNDINAILDTNSVNLTLAGNQLQADVLVDPSASNALATTAAGLFVPSLCVQIAGLDTASDIAVPVTADVVYVTTGGQCRRAPLPVAAAQFVSSILDTQSINLTVNGDGQLTADAFISATAGNQVSVNADGLFVPGLCAQLTALDTATDATVPAGAEVSYVRTDGSCGRAPLPAAAAPFINSISDTTSIDLSVDGAGNLTANAIVSPVAGNLLLNGATGLQVLCESVQDCIAPMFASFATYNDAGNALTFFPSGDAGNTLTLGGDGRPYAPDICTQMIALPPAANIPSGAAIVHVTSGGACQFAPLSYPLNADTGTAQSLDFGESLTISGGSGIATAIAAGNVVTVNLDRCDIQPLAPDSHLDISGFVAFDPSGCLARIDVAETCEDNNVNMVHGLGYRNASEGWVFGRFRERKVFRPFVASVTPSYTLQPDVDNVIAISNDAAFTLNLVAPNSCQPLDFHIKILTDTGIGQPISVVCSAGTDFAPGVGAPVTTFVIPGNAGRESFHIVFDGVSRWHLL